MPSKRKRRLRRSVVLIVLAASFSRAADWKQLQGDALRSGNVPDMELQSQLGLVAALPLTDGIYAAPVVADGKLLIQAKDGTLYAITR